MGAAARCRRRSPFDSMISTSSAAPVVFDLAQSVAGCLRRFHLLISLCTGIKSRASKRKKINEEKEYGVVLRTALPVVVKLKLWKARALKAGHSGGAIQGHGQSRDVISRRRRMTTDVELPLLFGTPSHRLQNGNHRRPGGWMYR